jgi:hypothetical protein
VSHSTADLPPGKRKITTDKKQNKCRFKTENKSTVCGVLLVLQVTLFLTAGKEGKEEKKIENKDKKKGERRRQNKEKEMGLFFDTERQKKPLLKHERKRGKRKTEQRSKEREETETERGERSLSLDTRGEKAEALFISS